MIKEYGYIAKRRQKFGKKQSEKNDTTKRKNLISKCTLKPTLTPIVAQLTPIVVIKKEDRTSPPHEYSIKHPNIIKNEKHDSERTKVVSKQKKIMEIRPGNEFRFDSIEHYPDIDQKNTRCKLEGCRYKSRYFCIKCKVHLCLKRQMNCFKKFHIFPCHKISQ